MLCTFESTSEMTITLKMPEKRLDTLLISALAFYLYYYIMI